MLAVAVDATSLLGERTGIGVAVDGFLRGLAARTDVSVTAYGLTGRGWRHLSQEVPAGVSCRSRPAAAAALLRAWGNGDRPSGRFWTGPADVVHGTNFVVPPMRSARRIVSVWDLTAVRFPELCTPTSRLYPNLVARAVGQGAWVHTGAESVADEITDHFGISRERVRVVAPAVDVLVPEATAGADGGGGAGAPYVLALGRTEPRKDLPTLVRAFDALAARQPDVELRLAGPAGWAEDEVAASISASRYKDRIHRVGWVDDPARLIAGAEVFAYPSLYEGFGLPPLEAMALGVPVVTTKTGSLEEVLGPAAEFVAPGDSDGLAGALERALVDRDRREQMIRRGKERAARFTTAQAAQGLVDAYRDVVAAGRN